MSEPLLTPLEAAQFLGLKVSTIRKWTFERKLPYIKLGARAVRFRRCDLEKLVRRGERPALRPVSESGAER